MNRRALMLVAWPAAAAANDRLQRRGEATRTWSPLRIPVYDAVLAVAPELGRASASAILQSPVPWRITLRYRVSVPREDVLRAWEASLSGIPLAGGFADWLAEVRAGDVERYDGDSRQLLLTGPRRPSVALGDGALARGVLAAFIGPGAPGELRRGLVPD